MAATRIAGIINFTVNGTIYNVVGNFSYNLGVNKREMMVGPDRVHGFKELPQVPYIEGDIRDAADLDVKILASIENATVVLNAANGKTIMLTEALFTGDGTVTTEDAVIKCRFEGSKCEEIPA